jgi:hypothetical protein
MLSRLRRLFESIAYAGMKPAARPGDSQAGKPGGLRGLIGRLVAGQAPTDPMYLTNRTWKQKLRAGLVIGIPCLLVAGAVGLGAIHLFVPKAAPPKEPTQAEIVAHLLPDIEKGVDTTPREAEISEIYPDTTGAPKLKGTLKNNTDHTISVEFTVDLWDGAGSKIDSLNGHVENAPAKSGVPFQFPINDPTAAGANVRPGSLRVVN